MKNNMIEKSELNIAKTYLRYPFLIEKGKGIEVYDKKGKVYLDFFSGISVCNLGHCHPEVVQAVKDQAEKLFHASNLFYTCPQINLAEKLINSSFADRVFFANSGAEANEAAIKLARKYGFDRYGAEKNRIITFEGSFHGRTLGTLAATGQEKIRHGFSPILQGFDYAKFDDIDSVMELISDKTCAIMLEPVQGEGGIRPFSRDFIVETRKICTEKGILLIFDEIQTGLGRTGRLFCYEHYDIVPDIMTLAKGLGNGMPVGCMLAKNHVMDSFVPGSHGSTFGGNPVSCAAADKVLEIIERDSLVDEVWKKGKYFLDLLDKLKEKHKIIKDVRGLGLLIGIELESLDNQAALVESFTDKGFLINIIQGNIIRLAPPFYIDFEMMDRFFETADNILNEL
ncbi:MAG: aspartate aminotransferase family protein [Deltaproteobacteria bacterium]|nr:MAG: aspartate aminotransferase family protein [Deltaproteobacteria bacterium]